MLFIYLALIILILTFVYQKHYNAARLRRVRKMMSYDIKFIWNCEEFPLFILEFAIMLLHICPFVDQVEMIRNQLDLIYAIMGFVYTAKLVYLFELMRHYSPLNTSKGRFVGSLSKINFNNAFLVKTWIKMNPVVAMPSAICWFLIINAYLLYLVERGGHYTTCYE